MNAVKKVLNLGSQGGAPPAEPSPQQLSELKEKYAKAGQDQVFTFYDGLSTAEKAQLFEQLAGFDPARINEITDRALHPPATDGGAKEAALEPLPDSATASILDSAPADIEAWYAAGLDLIGQNKVAVVLMAGGRARGWAARRPRAATTSGFPARSRSSRSRPSASRKVEELAGARTGAKATVPWYVMTSGPTRGPTEQYFREHKFFGLAEENVVIFEQGVLPCISTRARSCSRAAGRVAVAPDGNGGIYQALVVSGVLADLRERGIEHIHAYCVDNCLGKVADPVFIGFAAAKKVDIATKVVRKRSATEPVGLILLKNGRPDVVEYSEIDKATAEAHDASSRRAQVPRRQHRQPLLQLRFLDTIPLWAHNLPHHVARKKIPYSDLASATRSSPRRPNGIKLEQLRLRRVPHAGPGQVRLHGGPPRGRVLAAQERPGRRRGRPGHEQARHHAAGQALGRGRRRHRDGRQPRGRHRSFAAVQLCACSSSLSFLSFPFFPLPSLFFPPFCRHAPRHGNLPVANRRCTGRRRHGEAQGQDHRGPCRPGGGVGQGITSSLECLYDSTASGASRVKYRGHGWLKAAWVRRAVSCGMKIIRKKHSRVFIGKCSPQEEKQ